MEIDKKLYLDNLCIGASDRHFSDVHMVKYASLSFQINFVIDVL